MPSLSSPSLGEGSRTLRSGSTYVTPNEGSSPSRTLKRGDLFCGDTRRPVPAWAQAASLAREENQRVLREQIQAPLVYETGGIFPPARLCPREIQKKAKSDAQAALAELLRTPVHGVIAPCPAPAPPVITVPLPKTAAQLLHDSVWDSPIGSYFRRQAAKHQHADGHATSPAVVLDDSDGEDTQTVSSTVPIIGVRQVDVVTPLLDRFSSALPPSATAVAHTPAHNGTTALAKGPIPTRGDPEPVVSTDTTKAVSTNSWGVHPLMASSFTYERHLSRTEAVASDFLD